MIPSCNSTENGRWRLRNAELRLFERITGIKPQINNWEEGGKKRGAEDTDSCCFGGLGG